MLIVTYLIQGVLNNSSESFNHGLDGVETLGLSIDEYDTQMLMVDITSLAPTARGTLVVSFRGSVDLSRVRH